MSVKIEFVRVEPEHVSFIAEFMRPADVAEVMASHGVTPMQALTEGVKVSTWVSTVIADGVPVAIVGLVKGSTVISGVGRPWMLGTTDLFRIGKSLTKYSKLGLADMLEKCSLLENYVHADNKVSIRWLKVLGFKFDEPTPCGLNGEYFHRFWLEK